MDRKAVKERVKELVAKILKVDKDAIEDSSRFVEDLGAESIQAIELMAAFEEEFDIELDEDRAQSCKSINMAVDYIAEAIRKG